MRMHACREMCCRLDSVHAPRLRCHLPEPGCCSVHERRTQVRGGTFRHRRMDVGTADRCGDSGKGSADLPCRAADARYSCLSFPGAGGIECTLMCRMYPAALRGAGYLSERERRKEAAAEAVVPHCSATAMPQRGEDSAVCTDSFAREMRRRGEENSDGSAGVPGNGGGGEDSQMPGSARNKYGGLRYAGDSLA